MGGPWLLAMIAAVDLVAFVIATAVGYGLNVLSDIVIPKHSEMLHGFPARRWVFSVLIQSLLLVPAAVMSWYASDVGVSTWVAQGLDDMTTGGAFWTRWYLSTLFGMETRDFFPP